MKKTKKRVKQTGEVFTPPSLINEMLDKLPADIWLKPDKTWLEPAAGDGNFLVEIKARLLQAGHDERHILDNMMFSIELMGDNHWVLQKRLGIISHNQNLGFLSPNIDIWPIAEWNDLFAISKINKLSIDLIEHNPYAGLLVLHNHKYHELQPDEVYHHRNHICNSALEYDMDFLRARAPFVRADIPLLEEA